ncbi:SpoIIE family protein phosphatase [Streptomyces sp. JB150]|uniref:SpoIIE family protein phosphatase n=1 Tax=Streptomyces sp. JB150 TaxID=2714844 RepID=UPI001409C743|nr:SpoIIE family protein phosphatase [Streptomyces sp. JB150]QIJ60767.1 SpoIIE family protein phosphatase [Streptomyces sp. JB150]
MTRVWDIPVHDSTRVRDVRVAAEAACAEANLGAPRTAAAALVATELATNLLKHADGGRMVINLVEEPDTTNEAADRAVQIVSVDHGPGIGDVAEAIRDGRTTAASSLGAGLGTCLRVSDDFDLHSRRGRGTVAVARVGALPAAPHAPSRAPAGPRVGGVNLALAGAEHSGDAFGWIRCGALLTLVLADGLGHGVPAARASSAALDELRRLAALPPADILRRLHERLRHTRGAAVAVAQLDTGTGRLHFAGVGNVGARLRTPDGWQPLISQPGIVGARFPASVPLQQAPWTADSLLVLHSDGLPSRWTPPGDPGLPAHDPAVVAAVVLRDASSAASPPRDDTSVAVLCPDRRTDAHDRLP